MVCQDGMKLSALRNGSATKCDRIFVEIKIYYYCWIVDILWLFCIIGGEEAMKGECLVKEIQMNNFRSLKDAGMHTLSPITILVGENSSDTPV